MAPAQVGLPYTVISEPTDAAIQRGIREWATNRSGPFPRTKLAFAFTGRARVHTPLQQALPPGTPQLQGVRWEGVAKRATQLLWSSPVTPLLTARGGLRNWHVRELTFVSTHPGARGLLMNSSRGMNNSDGALTSVEFMGPWDYALALDGPRDANLNSEIVFDRLACGDTASFGRGLFVCGLNPKPQQDQFLNYTFRDTKLEGSHGDYLVFNKGGSVTVEGFNSWIHTGSHSPDRKPRGRMIYMPVLEHFDSVQMMTLNRVRAEIRSNESHLLDCGWDSRARITMIGVDTTAHNFRIPDAEDITIRNGAHLHLLGCALGGHVGMRRKGGSVTVDDPFLPSGASRLEVSDPDGRGVVRNYPTRGHTLQTRVHLR